MSAFRCARLDLTGSAMLVASDMTVVIAIPGTPVWGMMVGIPLSASRCTMRCDIFSTDDDYKLDDIGISDFKALVQTLIRDFEQNYNAMKNTRPLEEPKLSSILKDHLRLERLAGMDVHPSRKEENRSENFCRAEKGMSSLVSRDLGETDLFHSL